VKVGIFIVYVFRFSGGKFIFEKIFLFRLAKRTQGAAASAEQTKSYKVGPRP
jgi:hypothetical protein